MIIVCRPDATSLCKASTYSLTDGILYDITAYKCNLYKCYYTSYFFSFNDNKGTCLYIDVSKQFDTFEEATNKTKLIINTQYKLMIYEDSYQKINENIHFFNHFNIIITTIIIFIIITSTIMTTVLLYHH